MKKLAVGIAMALGTSAAAASTPSAEEMWEIIQQQQAQIEELRQRLARSDEELRETGLRVEATAELVEEGALAGRQGSASGWVENTRLGGYAEMHYSNLENDLDGGNDEDELDFHRFVLFAAHDFSDRTRFFSEVELEHSLVEGGEESGEVELEQAYIEHDLSAAHRLKAGLFLVPVGLLNETHEPDTFFGVERNNVEKQIIPTTWWEGGLGLSGELAPGFSYDAAITSGLGLDAEEGKWSVRDGRQKVAEADASDPAYTLRLRYTGLAGLELGGTVQYQQDLYQGELDDAIDAMLYEAHASYRKGPFGLRALAAAWDIDDGIEAFRSGADRQEGWYLEPSWRFSNDLGLFARYSEWDNQAGGGGDTEYSQWDLGLNYWLEESVVLKLDYQFQDSPDGRNQLDGVNLGVGWSY